MSHWQKAYRQVLADLFAMLPMFQRVGPVAYKKDLTNTTALLDALGNPERQFEVIHIAGTNGKGSLTHMIASLCIHHHRKTGLYTSPHYRDFRERIKIGSELIPPSEVVSFVSEHRALIEEVQPSFFELTVAMAFWYFARQKVDVAIVETGMGGRLDSTNVVHPVLSVITNIGFDHTDFLGKTLPEIAAEKAGIIKPGVPVVIGEEHPETAGVFLDIARERKSPITFASRAFQVMSRTPEPGGQTVVVNERSSGRLHTFHTDLEGPYQSRNLVTYLETVRTLERTGWLAVDDQLAFDSLQHIREVTRFMGRWQTIHEQPRVLVDSAHNEAGLASLFNGLSGYREDQLHIVYGTVRDKELSGVLSILPRKANYYFSQADVPRALPGHDLLVAARQAGLAGRSYAHVRGALKAAMARSNPDDLILVCGSIFVVAEVLPRQ